ncbi:hypothetical protein Y1Q_0012490 [Alligator mississippiensis]|uniref:Uncharacterized protein n=1 Tax=Alligator mississippiensis TaxID=8496 RepID=A0A151M7U4_ALLMI|nr:hypothetical protein Y1Q_0012490 [Alligator mississippiensis]
MDCVRAGVTGARAEESQVNSLKASKQGHICNYRVSWKRFRNASSVKCKGTTAVHGASEDHKQNKTVKPQKLDQLSGRLSNSKLSAVRSTSDFTKHYELGPILSSGREERKLLASILVKKDQLPCLRHASNFGGLILGRKVHLVTSRSLKSWSSPLTG